MHDLMDFILYVFDKTNEDLLWDTWTQGMSEMSFKDYKQKYSNSLRQKVVKGMSKEKEQQNIDFATQYIKLRKEEKNGDI